MSKPVSVSTVFQSAQLLRSPARSLYVAGVFALLVLLLLLPTGKTLAAEDKEFAGERIVHLLQEPRHRTVHQEGDLYLLDVQVNPGDVSFAHVHDQAIMLTYISSGDRLRGGEVSSITDYATESLTHKVSNSGPGLLRIIALVNAGSGNANLQADRPAGLSAEPQLEDAYFRSYRVELAPGEETSIQLHKLPSVVVQVADGVLRVSRDDEFIDELDHRADWAWRKAGQSYRVRNVGQVASAVVINEGRL